MTTTVIEKQEFACGEAPYRLSSLAHVELRGCTFSMCQQPVWHEPSERPVLRGVNLVRCHVRASELGPVSAEDCVVDTVWLQDRLCAEGMAYR